MRVKVTSFERLSDGGMIAHVEWYSDDGEILLIDHVRLPEWDDLADDPLAQSAHLAEQLARRKVEIERREALKVLQQQRLSAATQAFTGMELTFDADGTPYVEIIERKRVPFHEHMARAVQPRHSRGNQKA